MADNQVRNFGGRGGRGRGGRGRGGRGRAPRLIGPPVADNNPIFFRDNIANGLARPDLLPPPAPIPPFPQANQVVNIQANVQANQPQAPDREQERENIVGQAIDQEFLVGDNLIEEANIRARFADRQAQGFVGRQRGIDDFYDYRYDFADEDKLRQYKRIIGQEVLREADAEKYVENFERIKDKLMIGKRDPTRLHLEDDEQRYVMEATLPKKRLMTAIKMNPDGLTINRDEERRLENSLGSNPTDIELVESLNQNKAQFNAGQAGRLPMPLAGKIIEAIHLPNQNVDLLKKAFGSTGTWAPVTTTAEKNQFKEVVNSQYQHIIEQMSDLLGTRTSKTYWDGRLESTKALWDTWIELVKMKIEKAEREPVRTVIKHNGLITRAKGWKAGVINTELYDQGGPDSWRALTDGQPRFNLMNQNYRFIMTSLCFSKLRVFNEPIQITAPLEFGVFMAVPALQNTPAMWQQFAESFPKIAAKTYPVFQLGDVRAIRERKTNEYAPQEFGSVAIDKYVAYQGEVTVYFIPLRTWQPQPTVLPQIKVSFTSKYGPFDSVYKLGPTIERRYYKNTVAATPDEVVMKISTDVDSQYVSAISKWADFSMMPIGMGFVGNRETIEALESYNSTVLPYQISETASFAENFRSLIMCKATLAKWFWGKKAGLEKVAKDRLKRYLDKDKQDIAKVFHFLGTDLKLKDKTN